MIGELLRESEGVTREAGNPLASRVVEAFDMVGFTGELGHGLMLGSGNHTLVDLIAIRIECCLHTVCSRNLRLELCGTFPTAIPDMKRHDLARPPIHGHPNALFVGPLPHEATHRISFRIQLLHNHMA